MTTTTQIIKELLPDGSRAGPRWDEFPMWPPDLFAVVATLIERSGSYTYLVSNERGGIAGLSRRTARRPLMKIGRNWAMGKSVARSLQSRWRRLITDAQASIGGIGNHTPWCIAAHELLIIADTACRGVGFESRSPNWIQAQQLLRNMDPTFGDAAPDGVPDADEEMMFHPPTMCWSVPIEVACVQPKTRTPSVGCTVRSLSHHLALLPGQPAVHVAWHPTDFLSRGPDVFNLLVVPFPFEITNDSMNETRRGRLGAYFSVNQDPWLQGKEDLLIKFVKGLIDEGRRDVEHVHGILFPELALNAQCYDAIRDFLLDREYEDVEFFISGVGEAGVDGGMGKNVARTTAFQKLGRKRFPWNAEQKKHHRWKLDESQITDYSIGASLDPQLDWWEDIDISKRSLDFFVFRKGASFTTLVCEDLARVDPCQSVIRAVGPNLVFALLMDGPQLSQRWPGRYAMALADDPGSSVLSVTSLGLLERSNHRYQSSKRVVALWRDPLGTTRELDLPQGKEALLLSLTRKTSEEYTLDGRGDGGSAYIWRLGGCMPITSGLTGNDLKRIVTTGNGDS